MIRVELKVRCITTFEVPKDSERTVVTAVNCRFFFEYDALTLLHPDGVRGVYSIQFDPEGGESFTVIPEPGTLYTLRAAVQRIQGVFSSLGPQFFLKYQLYSESPDPHKIGFQ